MSGKGKGNRNISIISNSGNDQAIGTNNVIHIDDRSSTIKYGKNLMQVKILILILN